MTNAASALRRAAGRRARGAKILLAATLIATPLVGTASPAMADGSQQPQVDLKYYENEGDIRAAMQRWAPAADSESMMGYPQVEQNLTLADVKKAYDPEQAIKDAVAAAQKYADNDKNTEPLRESARKLVNGWPDAGTPQGNDVRQNTKDNALDGGQTAEQYCNMVNKDGTSASFGQTAPCVFVGKIANPETDQWPMRTERGASAGVDKTTVKISAAVTDEKSTTEGWTAGGKITPKVGDGKSEVAGEISFAYNYASTFTRRVTSTDEINLELAPQGTKQVSAEARANGAVYTGYIVLRGPTESGQRLVAIPAKAFVQSPDSGQPVTWIKRVKS
ncbi:hypothetical protein ACFVZM_29115 [Streptomyces sioyaensis]|uniref:hypothetical protein n=1 Tax=Streptomyces sioyaensis TaxID=67364 RepID=UPI0036B3AE2F